MTLPNCPQCGSEYTYEDRGFIFVQNVQMNGAVKKRINKKKDWLYLMQTGIVWQKGIASQ